MPQRRLHSAVILAVGSELTTGATRDTNSGELARGLSTMGVEVLRMSALPDRLERVATGFREALAEADLVVSTGGLGPTPDDLTREAIAAATGLEPAVDAELERWLRTLFRRRRIEMPASNLKQAWLVPGAVALHNDNGTAPGWWLDLADGRVIVALPGPPREMLPMWQAHVRQRLIERRAGGELATETLRLTGIGESALVALIGEERLRRPEPEVATYARADAVDVRVTARGPQASVRLEQAVGELMERVGRYVFGRGEQSWPEVLGRALDDRALHVIEVGTGGQVLALLGQMSRVTGEYWGQRAGGQTVDWVERAAAMGAAHVVLGVHATERGGDIHVEIAISDGNATHREERTAFLGGPEGRRRAALAACAALWDWLRDGRSQ